MDNQSILRSTVNKLKSRSAVASMLGRVPASWKAVLSGYVDSMSRARPMDRVAAQAGQTNDLLARLMYETALASPRFAEPQRLLRHGFKVYSQHDEDGIIEEIFRRIGTTDQYFVEFGVGDGLENCTSYLLLKEWTGAWIDGSAACYQSIQQNLHFLISQKRLRTKYSFITAENIEHLFSELNVPREFDFLSIDIDRNDFWIWKAIVNYRPRVVAIEYNASFKQTVACTVPYDATAIWNYSNWFGCSLKALQYLGADKGYRLVGCNYTGVTAFFVREDCVKDLFAAPFTSENHYEPPRYFVRMPNGHRAGFGPVVHISPEHRKPGG